MPNLLPVLAVQKLLKLFKIWQSRSQMYTPVFCKQHEACSFKFYQDAYTINVMMSILPQLHA